VRHLLAIEKLAIASLFISAGLVFAFQLEFYFPSADAFWFIFFHYFGPFLPALAIPAVIFMCYKTKPRAEFPRGQRLRALGAFALIVYVHFNFKLWAQLINPFLFDDTYMAIDEKFPFLVAFFSAMAAGFKCILSSVPNAYHEIFAAMFLVSFTIHGVQEDRKGFDHLLLAISLVLVFGGLSYAIAPAWGPFVYGTGDSPAATAIQQAMASFQQGLRESRGAAFEPSYFVAALGAMPSLHFAHALVFLYFAWRYVRWLGMIYFFPVTFIMAEAIASRWHYLVDLSAGLVVAFIGIVLAHRLLAIQPRPPVLLSS